MARFVLIHGAWHGAWCWQALAPCLEAFGHTVLAPDLPGMGADRTAFAEDVLTQWTDELAGLVSAQNGSVVLVGHSRGGLLVSSIAERMPQRVEMAIYLVGCLLRDGQSIMAADVLSEAVATAIKLNADQSAATIDSVAAQRLFYGHASPQVAAQAAARLTPEPMQPSLAPLALSASRFGQVRRAYVETLDDEVIPLDRQRRMQGHWPCDQVAQLDSDHSPFLSMPDTLAQVLNDLLVRQGAA